MSNVQLYLSIGLPTIAVLTTLAVNLIQVMGVRSDLQQLRTSMEAQFAEVRRDIRDIDKRLARV